MNETDAPACGCNYNGRIPIGDIYIGNMVAGGERRGQGADFAHEFLRLGVAIDRGVMNNMQALAYRTTVESGSGRTRSETNRPYETGAGTPS